jgi:acetyl/propionyl-CoA carboxylase alpha subunit
LKIASVEALQYFGNHEVYIEQFLNDVRHVEIQILGDRAGNIIHLFERECSVQRRHQKLIEESPAPITNVLREKLIETALEIARSVNYYGAGTVEFLVRDDQFWFLEMNPRIQVEHGVTEMVTGIDIVKQQILIAEGRALELGQNDVKHKGHSIEARIYAEDHENGLLPSPGTIRRFIIPDVNGLRADTGAADNTPVLPDFDPLIAKLIVHASDRTNAIEKMKEVISNTVITGIRHNLSLLEAVFRDDTFLRNSVSTTYLESNLNFLTEDISAKKQSDSDVASVAAAILLLNSKSSDTGVSPWQIGFWRNVRQIRLRKNNEIIGFEYNQNADKSIDFQNGDNTWNIREISIINEQLSFTVNSRKFSFYAYDDATDGLEISDGRMSFLFGRFSDNVNTTYENEEEIFSRSSDMITAPQPGTIMDIRVSEGQQVKRGDYLLTIESMKLENSILAAKHGYIKRIAIKAGDKVKKNEPLIYLQDNINN